MTLVSHTSQVDVRGADLAERRSSAVLAYRRLMVGDEMQVLDARDPIDLYSALQTMAPGDFSWLYRERGPDVWRVSVQKLARIYSAGECCGVCGGASPHTTQQAATKNPTRSNP